MPGLTIGTGTGSGLDAGANNILISPVASAALPGSPQTGQIAATNQATSPTIGSALSTGGSAFALVCWNGSQWTVIGN